jgi:single-stranded-DNA-specific exonuclease
VLAGPARAEAVAELRRALNLTAPFARLLARRGYSQPSEAEAFLNPKLDQLHQPDKLPDMAPAVKRLLAARQNKERVVLFGDYDVDGLSATALLARFCRLIGLEAQPLVPERADGGYGLSAEAVARIRAFRPQLLVTLDNGISAHEPLAALAAQGVDCVVLDHHHVGPGGAPDAVAVVNPRRAGAEYPFRELCAVGLTFKLAWALGTGLACGRRMPEELRRFLLDALALVALGTLADVAPLTGENRVLAANGLKALAQSRAAGLAALRERCGVSTPPTATEVAFRMAPRLNAAGRCGRAADALELLLTDDPLRAAHLAQHLDGLNRERQAVEQKILIEARRRAQEILARPDAPAALVLAGPGWHPGVIGIVAARLAEEFSRPAVLLALDGPGQLARGSARSIPGFHLAQALEQCSEHLVSHGGHAAAAGLKLRPESLSAFRASFEAVAARALSPEMLEPTLGLEEELPLEAMDEAFCRELARLEPCGAANPQPLWSASGVSVVGQVRPLGQDEKHLSFYARQDGSVRRAVGFGLGRHFNTLCEMAERGALDLAFRAELNRFRDQTSVELHLQAFRASRSRAREMTAGAGA